MNLLIPGLENEEVVIYEVRRRGKETVIKSTGLINITFRSKCKREI